MQSLHFKIPHSLVGYSEARGLAVQWPQSWAWPSAAGVPCLRILPETRVGDVDEGRAGAVWHSARRYCAQR